MNDFNPKTWLENYGDYLYNYALSRVKSPELAEDLVQETLMSAWRAREGFAGRSTEKTWLTSILRNKIIDNFRKTSKEDTVSYNFNLEPGNDDDGNFNAWGIWKTYVPNWLEHPDLVIENEEFLQAFQSCMEKLPENMRRVFVLKYLEEKEAEEVCQVLDISPSNYWTILYRIRARLRNCLQKNWYKK